jgi:histone arginine demethylase JMJD6
MRAARSTWATDAAWSALGLADGARVEEIRAGFLALETPPVLRAEDAGDYLTATVVEGGCAQWPAANRWTLDTLVSVLGDEPTICGLTTGGDEVRVPFVDFAAYVRDQQHDGPLYVFDDEWDGPSQALLADYAPPPWAEDARAQTPEPMRPPYRWLLVGPRRSGSNVHADPLGTSAWNALISGEKLWFLWEPSDATERTIRCAVEGVRADVPAVGFGRLLEAVRADACPAPRVFVQQPGEIVFVPRGWLHGVLNLSDTIAITENFVPSRP